MNSSTNQKSVAVIIAGNQKFTNTGMTSVDYSAFRFFDQMRVNFRLYALSVADESYFKDFVNLMPHAAYRVINEETASEILAADLIIYWGDFLHSKHYLTQYIMKYLANTNDERENKRIIDLYYRIFLLEGQSDDRIARTISFGSSMMFASQGDFCGDRYDTAFKRLYAGIKAAYPRDTLSRHNLAKFAPNAKIRIGCDPSFLIPANDKKDKTGILGLFVGRRVEINQSTIDKIIIFANENDLEIEWIPWFINQEDQAAKIESDPRRKNNLETIAGLSKRYYKERTRESRFMMLNLYDVIVTDTYHLCVNALNQGVVTFGIGDDTTIYDKSALDLHDKKKEILFNMYGLSHLYYKKQDEMNVDSMQAMFNSQLVSQRIYETKVECVGIKHVLTQEINSVFGLDQSPDQRLMKAAQLFLRKNAEYGNAYKNHSAIMFMLLGKTTLETEDDFNRFIRLNEVMSKINRYAKNFRSGGHQDSADDLMVFAAMLAEATKGTMK